MKIVITNEAWQSLEDELDFLISVRNIPRSKALSIGRKLVNKVNILTKQPELGQKEPLVEDLNQDHRRLVEGDYKIIYFIDRQIIYITDFFNTLRDPKDMRG